jgi:hypothetical protein
MPTELRLRLRPGFRDPITAGIGFIGRQTELARLISVLRHRGSATVLISGHRGVGKTTLVDQALKQCKTDALVVRLSLPHIYPGSTGTKDIRGQVLRSLARSLYFTIKESKVGKDLKERSRQLYQKTYLRELHEQGQLDSLKAAEQQQSVSAQERLFFEPGKTLSLLVGSVGVALAATGGLAVAATIANTHGPWWGVLSFVLIVLAGLLTAVRIESTHASEKTTTERVIEQQTATKTGSFDLSPETLEFELHGLLSALRDTKLKTVFIIDELDKLEVGMTNDQELEAHPIFAIMASLKNFFTLGAGIYVFISGEDFYARLEESISQNTYSLAHTLFTDRLFVHVLAYSELEELIDGLLERAAEDDTRYKKFRNYLCWESRSHVFDLLSIVDDYVAGYDGEVPLLFAHESYESEGRWQQGNLAEDWERAASLQKIVGATFDENARPSGRDERFNQALWLTLLDLAKSLNSEGTVITRASGYVLGRSRWTSHLRDRDLDDLAGAIDRFLARCERYGLVVADDVVLDPLRAEEMYGIPVEADETEDIEAIEYELKSKPPYPDSSVGTHAAPTPFEEGFKRIVDALKVVRHNLEAAGLDSSDYSDSLSEILSIATAVDTRPNRRPPPRSDVREALQAADSLLPQLIKEGVFACVGQWVNSGDFSWTRDLAEPHTFPGQQPAQATPSGSLSLAEFEPMREIIQNNGIDHALISTSDRENQILVVYSVASDTAKKLHDAYRQASPGNKGTDRRVQRLPVIEIRLTEPDGKIDWPMEVVEVVETSPAKGWVAWMSSVFGNQPSTRSQSSRRLAGWNVFGLAPDASNISQLRHTLNSASYLSPDHDET